MLVKIVFFYFITDNTSSAEIWMLF